MPHHEPTLSDLEPALDHQYAFLLHFSPLDGKSAQNEKPTQSCFAGTRGCVGNQWPRDAMVFASHPVATASHIHQKIWRGGASPRRGEKHVARTVARKKPIGGVVGRAEYLFVDTLRPAALHLGLFRAIADPLASHPSSN